MSGGERKKRASRAQGWEEAGAEFYQESYPGDADLDALQRDPTHIATLLPSKQCRAATTKRIRSDAKQTLNRRTSTRNRYASTARRPSAAVDVHVAMLPDLSENLSNEERTWEEIMQIKAMPVSMAQKKELKAKLQNATKLRLQGLEQLKWQKRKLYTRIKNKWKEAYAKLELWNHSLKKIEGNFGTGVVAYFLFVKWLMFLNLVIFGLMFTFVILPVLLLEHKSPEDCDLSNMTSPSIACCSEASIACCSEAYFNQTSEGSDIQVLDIIQGTGWMEKTIMFYGIYPNYIYEVVYSNLYYDLPLAYIGITTLCFLVSLGAIVKSAARGFKDRLVEGEGQFYHYCNLVFGGWDFCIHNEKSAVIKHKALFNEMKGCLMTERREEERKRRSRDEKTKLVFARCFINVIVILVLIASGALIFYTFKFSSDELARLSKDPSSLHPIDDNIVLDSTFESFYKLLLEFLPYMAIVSLNLLVPNLFKYFVTFEDYSPLFVVRITLWRTVFLRLSSLGVLLTSIYNMISCNNGADQCISDKCPNKVLCWETYVGQQFYKLVILDFVTHIIITFFVNLPRMLIAKHFNSRVAKMIGEQEFELPKHVLDVVYSQTLCWLGSFYAPILPALLTVEYFIMFYIKKFACLVNSRPSPTVYRASRSNSLFMFVLLLSFVVAVVPVAYSVAELSPSKSCGPFRGQPSVWYVVVKRFMQMPDWIKSILFFFGTAAFAVPAFIVLTLFLYYYYAVSAANKHMVVVLKNQLVLEGHDKQFLLNRLSAFIKQQQDHQKAMRHVEIASGPADMPHTS